MTDIDFHVELYNAYLQPPGAEIDYLTRVRKKGEYSKGSFILNLENAFNNLREAWENEYNFKRSRGLNPDSLIDFAFPMSALNRYPALSNFSKIHYGHISKVELEGLSKVLTLYKIQMKVRSLKKLIDEKTGEAQTDIPSIAKNDEVNQLENKFNQMPMNEVRSHFKPFIEKKNPKKIVWMTNEDFDIFLRRSFGKDESLEKPKINLCHGAKYAIVKLFYQFYEKCQIEDYNQNRNKEPFLNLLNDAFLTKEFEDLDTSNFKASNSKYEWD